MRWDALFDDLEAQLDRQAASELWSEVAERSRAEVARLMLSDRLRAHEGQTVALRLRDGTLVEGVCRDVGVEWVVLVDGPRHALVPTAAATVVMGLTRAAAPEPGMVVRRLGLPHALRAVTRGRSPVSVRFDGGQVSGTIDRVAADHFDVAEHPLDEPRRMAAVRQVVSVRTASLLVVHGHTDLG